MQSAVDGTSVLGVVPFHVVRDDPDHVVFSAAGQTLRLKSSAAAQIIELLLPLLNGSLDEDQICARLAGALPELRVRALLAKLREHGLLTLQRRRPAALDADLADLLESVRRHFDHDHDGGWQALLALRQASVAVVHLGALGVDLMRSLISVGIGRIVLLGADTIAAADVRQVPLLRADDLGRTWRQVLPERLPFDKYRCRLEVVPALPAQPADWQAALEGVSLAAVALDSPSYFHDLLFALNAAALQVRRPWLVAGHIHRFGHGVGPCFVPGATACFKCFELRLKSNLHDVAVPELLERYVRQGGERVDFGGLAPRNEIVAHLAALEICHLLVPPHAPRTAGRMLSVDLEGYGMELHHVLRLPRCPACGVAQDRLRWRAWG